MPAYARTKISDPKNVTCYHLIARCVRQLYLCGVDPDLRKDYSHRKEWIEDLLTSSCTNGFLIEVLSYSVMSNHFHLVIKTRQDITRELSDQEVVARWSKLYPTQVANIFREKGGQYFETDLNNNKIWIDERRSRLTSISWLMRYICEKIARRANKEEGKSGRFWQGRFKSQMILDQNYLINACTYVDLNPVRAGQAASLETSEHTSVYSRLKNQKTNLDLIRPIVIPNCIKPENFVKYCDLSLSQYMEHCFQQIDRLIQRRSFETHSNQFENLSVSRDDENEWKPFKKGGRLILGSRAPLGGFIKKSKPKCQTSSSTGQHEVPIQSTNGVANRIFKNKKGPKNGPIENHN